MKSMQLIKELAPVEFQAQVNAMTTEDRRVYIDELDAIMQKAAMLRGYLDARYGHGCGDQGHQDGVKACNRLVAKVRKALGFTIAKRDLTF